MPADLDLERARERYRPEHVTLLFVGESPAASGRFFYFGSGIVFASTQRAFAQAFHRSFASTDGFFHFFQRTGCHLDDLSHAPVDGFAKPEREKALAACIEGFAQRLRALQPQAIIVILKKIAPFVKRAATLVAIPTDRSIVLPFPGNGHQNRYVAHLSALLEQAQIRGEM